MLFLCLPFLFATISTLEHTRVSRIKPTFFNYYPEAQEELMSTPNPPITEAYEVTNRHLSTLHATVRTYQTTSNPVTVTRSCEKPYSCVDCTTFRVCAPSVQGFQELFSGSCPPDRPYCDSYSGTCVNTLDAALRCGTPDQSFYCMQDGHFPHADDATKYFICSNLKAFAFSCREGYKYHAPSQECNKFSWISTPFDCSEMNATKVVYKNGGMFFAYCLHGKAYTVSKCSDNEFFNVTSQVCEPQCHDELIVPDSNNCLKYFQCLKNTSTGVFEKISFQCPSGEGFSKALNKCVPLKNLKDCK